MLPVDINKRRKWYITTDDLLFALQKHSRQLFGNCSQVISREVFCHEYGKIPRHTGQNAITEGDLECILTKLL